MSRLFEFGRLGKVYIGWYAGNAKGGDAPLDIWTSRGELQFVWKALHVIVTPPSAMRGAATWGTV